MEHLGFNRGMKWLTLPLFLRLTHDTYLFNLHLFIKYMLIVEAILYFPLQYDKGGFKDE